MERYEYVGKLRDSVYFRALVSQRVAPCIGLTEYPDRFIIYFEKALTSEQKAMLDSLVAENPVPVSTYELRFLDESDIETEIGVRPVMISIDPMTGAIICHFDTTLTLEQETMLEALLRSPMRFKRRKP